MPPASRSAAHLLNRLLGRRARSRRSKAAIGGVALVVAVAAAVSGTAVASAYRRTGGSTSTLQSLYSATSPTGRVDNDVKSVTLGVTFSVATAGKVAGIEFFRGSVVNTAQTVTLWSSTGDRLATSATSDSSTLGWVRAYFTQPIAITAGTRYVATYFVPAGRYNSVPRGFTEPRTQSGITAQQAAERGMRCEPTWRRGERDGDVQRECDQHCPEPAHTESAEVAASPGEQRRERRPQVRAEVEKLRPFKNQQAFFQRQPDRGCVGRRP